MAIRLLHGSLDNIGTQRVMASLFEHQLHFEFLPVTLPCSNSFLSLSPFGEIPVLEDGDLILFESRAAMRYISHEYASQAIQQVYITPLMQGVVATWIDVETHQFQPPAMTLISELIEKPQSDEAAVAAAEEKLGRVLDVYEERLTTSEYLGGDKFTAADLSHSPYLHRLMQCSRTKRLFESRERVAAWCSMLLSRPAWAMVMDFVAKKRRV